ncbi:MAG: BatA domain-containing protein, partial [Thermoguttaceae bacterium]
MTFLHPWAIVIGVAAAAAPVLIHWLTSPRPTRMPLSTIRFLREAVHQRRSWRRLRDALLLAIRTLAILLIALAVARPQWGKPRQVSGLQQGSAVRVVLLDLSQSMAARSGAVELSERARTVAAEYLRYRPGLAADLILAAARPQAAFDAASTNFDALRDELSRCRVLPQRLDVNRALDLAARILAPTGPNDHRRRELVLVSDFQRSSWGGANFSPLPADTHIQFESVAPAQPLANVAILRVEPRAADLSGSTQLAVEVGNYSPNDRKVTVEVSVGNSSWRLSGAAAAKRVTTLTEEIGARDQGWQPGEARLLGVDDALAADNVYHFVLRTRPAPKYVLLTRQAAGRRPTSSLFLECAVAPDSRRNRRVERSAKDRSPTVARVDPASLDRAVVASSDLILIDHPGKLAPEAIELLADLLRRGRPVVYVASEMIDA